jgi:hypothetical protein
MPKRFNDPVLGNVRTSADGSYIAKPTIAGSILKVTIDLDGEELEPCLQLARTLVRSAEKITLSARQTAARELLATYNDCWREYQEADESGQLVDVSKPRLSKRAFAERLTLQSARVSGGECCELFLDDGGLFWGHRVVVTTFDAGASWPHAELFG